MAINLKQGDEFALPVKITVNGEALPVSEVERVEFTLGGVRKLWPEDAEFDDESGEFRVRFAQEDTFTLPEDDGVQFDVRVKFHGGAVIGVLRMPVLISSDALSEQVI